MTVIKERQICADMLEVLILTSGGQKMYIKGRVAPMEKLDIAKHACLRTMIKMKVKQKGLTTVEYAVAGSLVTLAVVGAFIALGGAVNEAIFNLEQAINSG